MVHKLIGTDHRPRNLNIALLILRVSIACLMLFHGIPKVTQLFSEGSIQFGDPIGLGENVSFMLVIFAEFFCSVLIFFGVFTRIAVLPLIINMLVIVFVVHIEDGFGRMEVALHYLLVYVVLLIAGSGKYSVDKWFMSFDRLSRKK